VSSRDLDAEEIRHAGVPGLRQVLRGRASLDQTLLELEARMMWQAVRRLVGLDADEPGLGAVDGGEEGVEVDVAQLLGNASRQRLVPVEPERAAPSDEVLPGAALGTSLRPSAASRRAACARATPRFRARSGRAGLVHRRPEPVEAALEARRHATSRRENDVQNGCTVGSRRYEPSSRPIVARIRS
jgi:hypothetical protein